MPHSAKTPASIRHGGPGASQENAKKPVPSHKQSPDTGNRMHSKVSGGGGESDAHHTHDPGLKGGHGF